MATETKPQRLNAKRNKDSETHATVVDTMKVNDDGNGSPQRTVRRKRTPSADLTPRTTSLTGVPHHSASKLAVGLFIIIIAMLWSDHGTVDGNSISGPAAGGTIGAGFSAPSAAKERGKEIGLVVTAADLHQAYREIQQDYLSKAFGPKEKWTILKRRKDIEVSMLETPNDPNCPYVKMKVKIPTSVGHCWNFLLLKRWNVTMPKMDPFYEGVEIHSSHEHDGVSLTLARKRTKRILAFGKRDFTFVSVSDKPLEDGTWVSGTVSVQTPALPRNKEYTRAFQDSIAFYKPISDEETEVTMVCRIDLNDSTGRGGAIPMWLYVKTIGTTAAMSLSNMRKHLQLEVEEWAEKKRGDPSLKLPWAGQGPKGGAQVPTRRRPTAFWKRQKPVG